MQQEFITDLLSELVSCPSVNPKGLTPTGPPFGEKRLLRLLSERLKSWGAETDFQEVYPERPNLIAHFKGKNPSRTILLEAHADTVQTTGMTIAPFAPEIVNGRLYGRGSCDTKGPMAAILSAIKFILDEDGQLPTDLYFVSTCDEELGANGAHAFVKRGLRPDLAVVGEPTDLTIVHSHKGAIRWTVTTHGTAAHSSTPHLGINAIYSMGKFLEVVEKRMVVALENKRHPLLGSPSLSVGTIEGGTQVNVIPSECRIELDRRTIPGETQENLSEELVQELERLSLGDNRFKYSIRQTEWYPAFEESVDSPVARLVAEACERTTGKVEFTTAPWAANSGVFKEAGIPCVLFGPGSIRQAHTKDEYVNLDQVYKAVDVYKEIIRQFAREMKMNREFRI